VGKLWVSGFLKLCYVNANGTAGRNYDPCNAHSFCPSTRR
jgi:hypothetical protein